MTILVAIVPDIIYFGAGDFICKKVSLNQKSWLPNGEQAKTLTWRVEVASFCNLKWTYVAYPQPHQG